MKRQLIMVALAAAMAAPSAFAITDAQLSGIKKSMIGVPVPELPAKAAELVKQAAKEDREAVAVAAVRAAIYKSRPSAPLVVAAVSKAAPEVAGPASRVAAEMEAGQSESISIAASGAAPSAKTQITASVQQGLYGSVPASTTAATFAPASTVAPTVSHESAPVMAPSAVLPLAASPAAAAVQSSAFTVRGDAKTSHGGSVLIRFTPINHSHGGEGNGRFPTHPPFSVPPGHDPEHQEHHGKPPFVDYTKPRCF